MTPLFLYPLKFKMYPKVVASKAEGALEAIARKQFNPMVITSFEQ